MSYIDAADPSAKPDPSKCSSDYDAQITFWNMVDAILGGEAAIKAGRRLYLPQFPRERDSVYSYRLANAPWTGIYADISKNLAAKPFGNDLKVKDGTPTRYVDLADNIDGQGNNLHVFAAAVLKEALDKGIAWILVDYPKVNLPENRSLTIAEETQAGVNPYWVHIHAQQMLAVYSDFVDGVEIVHDARIREQAVEIAGFTETTIERVRHFHRAKSVGADGAVSYAPATWTLWEKSFAANGDVIWSEIDSGNVDIAVIPLVPVVLTKRRGGSWLVEPPLRDLAYAQITEYRQEANLEWIKLMTCFPMLVVSGLVSDEKTQVDTIVGPNTVIFIPQNTAGSGPAGDAKFIEPSSQSIAENRTQLELTRKEMRDLGMQPLAQANLTVVISAHLSKKASSIIQAWTFLFKDKIELALKYTALWLNDQAVEPEIVIHTDFAIEVESGAELDTLIKSQAAGILSKQTVRGDLKRRRVVVNDLNDEQELQRIAEEEQGLVPEQAIDPVTGERVAPPTRPKVISAPAVTTTGPVLAPKPKPAAAPAMVQ